MNPYRVSWQSALLVLAAVPAVARAQAPARASAPPTVRVTGYFQPRFQAVGDSASFFLRRARFAVEGQATPWATFRAQVEMRTIGAPATPPSSPLTLSATDLFVRLSHERWGGTVGQFRVPLSLEALLSSTTLETNERSRIVNVARRDIGVQADWHIPQLVLQAAVVNGEGPNRATNPDNRMAYFARAIATPVHGLDVGGAFAGYSDSTVGDAQAMYRLGRWTARAEYIRAHHKAGDFHTRGWYLLAAYNVGPQQVQAVARVQQYDPSDKVATDRSTGYLAGVQYFMRGDDFKLVADYEIFREQVVQVKNNRAVVQMQVRF
jgi:phosphate-selective porin OprO and OprP